MNCKNCGNVLTAEDMFCKNCGTPVPKSDVGATIVNMSPIENQVPVMNQPVMMTSPVQNPVVQPEVVTLPQPKVVPVVANPVVQPEAVAFPQPMATPVMMSPTQEVTPQNAVPSIQDFPTMRESVPVSNPTVMDYSVTPNQADGVKKEVNSRTVMVAVVAFLVVVIIALLVVILTGNKNQGVKNEKEVAVEQSYIVNFDGFTFTIPGDMVYDKGNSILLLADEQGTWTAKMIIDQGSFEQLKKNKSLIQQYMIESGYNSTVAEEKTAGGVEFITLELGASTGEKAIASYAKLNSMHFASILIENRDNTIDYQLLDKVAKVIKTAKMTDTSSSILPSDTFDIEVPDTLLND